MDLPPLSMPVAATGDPSLESLSARVKAGDPKALPALAKQFESVFLTQILKEMRQTLDPDGGGMFGAFGGFAFTRGVEFDQIREPARNCAAFYETVLKCASFLDASRNRDAVGAVFANQLRGAFRDHDLGAKLLCLGVGASGQIAT